MSSRRDVADAIYGELEKLVRESQPERSGRSGDDPL